MKYSIYKNLIRKLAWNTAKKYKYDHEELFSEACLIFSKTVKEYDSSKARFSTFLYTKLYYGLSDYVKKNKFDYVSLDEYEESNLDAAKIYQVMNNQLYSNEMHQIQNIIEMYDYAANTLSKSARQILRCLIETYEGKVPTYNSVMKYFYYFIGWKKSRVFRAWQELKKWWSNYKPSVSVY